MHFENLLNPLVVQMVYMKDEPAIVSFVSSIINKNTYGTPGNYSKHNVTEAFPI